MSFAPVLAVENLHTHIPTPEGIVKAVNGISFQIGPGRVLGLVGESGCGKSITCLSILGLLNTGRVVDGKIRLKGRDILNLSSEEMRKIRGKEISMIMQNPMSSFNPVVTIGQQFIETLRTHKKMAPRKAKELAIEYLHQVGLPYPKDLLGQFPFQLSGGMLQRVMIAIAIALNPAVIIADEPTTALDLTVQNRILGQLARLKEKYNTGIILVSHDLSVVAQLADDVAVMYGGYIVEKAPVMEIFSHPLHPYTRALMASRPSLGKKRLRVIGGQPPTLLNLNDRCPFFERCGEVSRACLDYTVELLELAHNHFVGCVKYETNQEVILYDYA